MAFDQGIDDFLVRRHNFFQNIKPKETFEEQIQQLKERIPKTEKKPLIVISGAGPAGLLRAIQSVGNGNPTKVIERRSKDAKGRNNTVALTKTTVSMLDYCGIYAYLLENGLIYPPDEEGTINVRLKDLEEAMKRILQELNPDSIIQYNSKISKIIEGNKIKLIISSMEEETEIPDVDIFVNAEGAHSSTNKLLGIKRIEVLPFIPVIAALCKDDRPDITNIPLFFIYLAKSIAIIAITIYYHTIFFFQYLFSKDFRKQITGSLILPTPGQNYVGCAFSDEINNRLNALKESNNQEEYFAFAKHWINLAICNANMVCLWRWLENAPSYYHTGCNLPINSFEIAPVGADYATSSAGKINESSILLAGDASATVDPTTGLGCNTAIQSSVNFLEFIWDYEQCTQDDLLTKYHKETNDRIEYIHRQSYLMRRNYRPDSLVPTTFKAHSTSSSSSSSYDSEPENIGILNPI